MALRTAETVALARAIAQGELRVHYQPIVSWATGRIAGWEALVRWMDPARGLLLPAAFLPLAEDTGLVMELDAYVFREACRQQRRWRDQGLNAPVSVNFSGRSFLNSTLSQQLERELREQGLDGDEMAVEITETTEIVETAALHATLAHLRNMGVGLYLDDFGTGYSSLAYLVRYPMTRVKIPRTFIEDMMTSPRTQGIVESTLRLLHSAGLETVAEGVETPEQARRLQSMGCEYGQGFYYSVPLNGDDASQLVRQLPNWI